MSRKKRPTLELPQIRQFWLFPITGNNSGKLRPVRIRGVKVDSGWYSLRPNTAPVHYSARFWREAILKRNPAVLSIDGRRLCPHCKRFNDAQSMCPHCKNYLSGFFAVVGI